MPDRVAALIAADEANRSAGPVAHPPHPHTGRQDRDCDVCGKPDRHPIHDGGWTIRGNVATRDDGVVWVGDPLHA